MKKFFIDDYQIEKAYEDSQNDCLWRIRSLKDPSSEFAIHVAHSGQMYITHFPGSNIPFKVRVALFKTLCEYLQKQEKVANALITAEEKAICEDVKISRNDIITDIIC